MYFKAKYVLIKLFRGLKSNIMCYYSLNNFNMF